MESREIKYGAITIDTSIFDKYGLRLEFGLFEKLSQFKEGLAVIILSEITIRELEKHLGKRINEAQCIVEKALKECSDHLIYDENDIKQARTLIVPRETSKELAKKRLKKFIDHAGVSIVPANNMDISELVDKYFNSRPPFAESGQKKNEFPDAIALMTLEGWAKQNNKKIIAVSTDNDWHEFGKKSEYVDVTNDLAQAIAIFQPHNAAFAFCRKLASDLLVGAAEQIRKSLEIFLLDFVASLDLYAEASSAYYYESDYVEATYVSFEFQIDQQGKAQLLPVQIQDNTIVIEAKIMVQAVVSSSFTFSVHDSIDKDDMKIGEADCSRDYEFDTTVLMTLTGNFDKEYDVIKTCDFEILSRPKYVDFGEIGPDWDEPEPGYYDELGYNEDML